MTTFSVQSYRPKPHGWIAAAIRRHYFLLLLAFFAISIVGYQVFAAHEITVRLMQAAGLQGYTSMANFWAGFGSSILLTLYLIGGFVARERADIAGLGSSLSLLRWQSWKPARDIGQALLRFAHHIAALVATMVVLANLDWAALRAAIIDIALSSGAPVALTSSALVIAAVFVVLALFTLLGFLLRRLLLSLVGGGRTSADALEHFSVYLRGFRSDLTRVSFYGMGWFGITFDLESQIIAQMSKRGPIVALGSPQEQLPPLGAARIRASDADWKGVVEQLIAGAEQIVFMVGVGNWLPWELAQIERAGRLEDTVILVTPKLSDSIRAQWRSMIAGLQDESLRACLARIDLSDTLAITFESGRVIAIKNDFRDMLAYDEALTMLKASLPGDGSAEAARADA